MTLSAVASRHVVQLGSARADDECLLVGDRAPVDRGASGQPVGAGWQRAEIDVRLTVRVGGGVQAARRLGVGRRGRADDRQRHLDVGGR